MLSSLLKRSGVLISQIQVKEKSFPMTHLVGKTIVYINVQMSRGQALQLLIRQCQERKQTTEALKL